MAGRHQLVPGLKCRQMLEEESLKEEADVDQQRAVSFLHGRREEIEVYSLSRGC